MAGDEVERAHARFIPGASPTFGDATTLLRPPFRLAFDAGRHLDVLRTRNIHIVTGEGKWENIGESWRLANVLGEKGIPNYVDSWGPDWDHDWVTWRAMMPRYLREWTA